MKLYKDSEDNIFAYELDGSQDHLIEDKKQITQQEADKIIAEKLAPIIAQQKEFEEKRAVAIAKLAKLGLTEDEITVLLGK